MPDKTLWRYVPPDDLRQRLAWHELEIASIKLTLDAVEHGNTVMLGDGPHGEILYTGKTRRKPFNGNHP
jgi:hypothetical protein